MVPNARRTGGQPPHEYEYCIPFRTSFSCCIDVRRTCHSCPSLIVSSLHMHCNGRAVLERREREHSTRPSFVVCCLEMSCVSPLKCQMAENTFISLLRGCVCAHAFKCGCSQICSVISAMMVYAWSTGQGIIQLATCKLRFP